ncbi:MAG TPA: hypothetical protein VLC98_15680 [Phnomibacter sp.]|nr:hypothetical protein [Phnomibacter sp.]
MKKFPLALCTLFCFSYAQCLKDKLYDDGLDDSGLPRITQEGKNTLGFMLNGEPWLPAGNNVSGNLSIYYDPTFSAGVFNIAAHRYTQTPGRKGQKFNFFGDYIQTEQRINLPNAEKFGLSFFNDSSGCVYSTFDSSLRIMSGYFEITKLDKSKGIFSAEFDIKFQKTGCETIHISNGRLDMKL